jgi:hypothetical protein
MIYSLVSRFKGGLVGALLGENLASNQGNINLSAYQPSYPLQVAMAAAKSTINCGRLDLKSWLINLGNSQGGCLQKKNTANSSQTAIASLPIALFCYENLTNLQENLQLAINLWQRPDLEAENVLIWGYTINIILQNQLNVNQLVSQIRAIMDIKQLSMPKLLTDIDIYIQHKSPLAEVANYLHRNCNPHGGAIAQALYCFATVPNDFGLCVKRALQSNYQPQLTATLAGSLSGLYNSYTNIPWPWRAQVKQSALGKEMEGLSERLFAVWSGCYQPEEIAHHQACYAPGMIQARDRQTMSFVPEIKGTI